jgi:hypothetical protein
MLLVCGCANRVRVPLELADVTPDQLGPRIGRLATIDASLLRAERSQFQSDVIASALETHGHLHDADAIISWFTEFKTRYDLNVESIPLDRVQVVQTEDASVQEEDTSR